MTDEPSRIRVHLVPPGEGSERLGIGIVSRAEIRHEDLDPAEAPLAEPVFLERPARGRFPSPASHTGPVSAGGIDFERAFEEPGVHPRRLTGSFRHVPLL